MTPRLHSAPLLALLFLSGCGSARDFVNHPTAPQARGLDVLVWPAERSDFRRRGAGGAPPSGAGIVAGLSLIGGWTLTRPLFALPAALVGVIWDLPTSLAHRADRRSYAELPSSEKIKLLREAVPAALPSELALRTACSDEEDLALPPSARRELLLGLTEEPGKLRATAARYLNPDTPATARRVLLSWLEDHETSLYPPDLGPRLRGSRALRLEVARLLLSVPLDGSGLRRARVLGIEGEKIYLSRGAPSTWVRRLLLAAAQAAPSPELARAAKRWAEAPNPRLQPFARKVSRALEERDPRGKTLPPLPPSQAGRPPPAAFGDASSSTTFVLRLSPALRHGGRLNAAIELLVTWVEARPLGSRCDLVVAHDFAWGSSARCLRWSVNPNLPRPQAAEAARRWLLAANARERDGDWIPPGASTLGWALDERTDVLVYLASGVPAEIRAKARRLLREENRSIQARVEVVLLHPQDGQRAGAEALAADHGGRFYELR